MKTLCGVSCVFVCFFFAFHLPYGNLHNAQTNHEVTMIKYHKMWLKYYRHVVYFFIHFCIQKHEKKCRREATEKKQADKRKYLFSSALVSWKTWISNLLGHLTCFCENTTVHCITTVCRFQTLGPSSLLSGRLCLQKICIFNGKYSLIRLRMFWFWARFAVSKTDIVFVCRPIDFDLLIYFIILYIHT